MEFKTQHTTVAGASECSLLILECTLASRKRLVDVGSEMRVLREESCPEARKRDLRLPKDCCIQKP